MAEIGTLIDKKYKIIKKIGQGGMSTVYLAKDNRVDKLWAVKEVKKYSNDKNSQITAASLLTEAKLIKKLDHPALPHIIDVIEDDETIYLVMDYIEGKPLDVVLDKQGIIPQQIVIEWAIKLCGVLNYLHNQRPSIIYRDMKPANIMLMSDGNIKLIDFGIAREYKENNLADTVNLGTKGYAAPEQFGGNGQTDAKTDIYCLGVTLYHLVTGKNPSEPPYELLPIRKWNSDLSGAFEKIILKCTQRNPEDRYQSCAEMMYALKHYEEVDFEDNKKKKNKIKCTFGLLSISIVFAILGLVCGSYEKNYSLDAFLISGVIFLISVVFCLKFKVITTIKHSHKTKKNGNEILANSKTISMPENDTSLLMSDTETTLLSNNDNTSMSNVEEGTTILSDQNETTLLDAEVENDISSVSSQNQKREETSLLNSRDEDMLLYSEEKADTIIHKKVDPKNKDFQIVESVMLINTKEEIA